MAVRTSVAVPMTAPVSVLQWGTPVTVVGLAQKGCPYTSGPSGVTEVPYGESSSRFRGMMVCARTTTDREPRYRRYSTMSTPREALAELLKQARIDAGYGSHGALATAMKVSRPVVSRAENPTCPVPTDDVLTGWAGITGVAVAKLTDLATRARSGTPEWFIPYRQAESEATTLRSWASMIFPGLTQTEAYAREVLSAERTTPAHLNELVTARMERQQVLQRAFYTVVIDAGVLSRCVGSPQIMADQCTRLLELAELPNVTIHVVPEHTTHGAWAALDIATSKDGLSTVCYSTADDDITTANTERAERALRTFERVLGLALPPTASLECIREAEETWKNKI